MRHPWPEGDAAPAGVVGRVRTPGLPVGAPLWRSALSPALTGSSLLRASQGGVVDWTATPPVPLTPSTTGYVPKMNGTRAAETHGMDGNEEVEG